MDALKVKEETGLSYCSQNEGMMHACGHDMHMAMVLGLHLFLNPEKINYRNNKIVFQPSEEKRPGARLLLPELLKEPVPQAIFDNMFSRTFRPELSEFVPGPFSPLQIILFFPWKVRYSCCHATHGFGSHIGHGLLDTILPDVDY